MNLLETNRIFGNIPQEVIRWDYAWPEIIVALNELRRLGSAYPEIRDNEEERQAVILAWSRLHFLTCAPIEPDDARLPDTDSLKKKRDDFATSYSERRKAIASVLAKIVNLVGPNPLVRSLKDVKKISGGTKLMLFAKIEADLVEEILSSDPSFEGWSVVVAQDIRDHPVLGTVVVCGNPSSRHVPSFLFDSGRSKSVIWVQPRGAYSVSLPTTPANGRGALLNNDCKDEVKESPGAMCVADADEFDPWPSSTSQNEVSFLTKGGRITTLEPNDAVFVVELEEGIRKVSKMKASELSDGMLVMLRDRDPGGAVADVADRLLGSRKAELRGKQSEWKEKLRHYSQEHGYNLTAGRLNAMGCSNARVNLRTWMSSSRQRISVRSREDFRRIMALIGMPDEADEYFNDLTVIKGEHIRAGDVIVGKIQARIAELDDKALARSEEFKLQFDEFPGERIVAARISDIRKPESAYGEED